MSTYAFWNNKGGVGKSFLCFISSCEYANQHPETDVYVIDLCPQANVSETLLGGYIKGAKNLEKLLNKKPRTTIAGYLDERLNSPFKRLQEVSQYVSMPHKFNSHIPKNLHLICGDNLLEVQSEAIRQTSQLAVPADAWKQVVLWVKDLCGSLKKVSGGRPTTFFIDCNPSFAIFTQLALAAADNVVVPFTADDSSRRAVENVAALLFGVGNSVTNSYSKLSFSKKALDEGVEAPKLHTFISNRVTQYEGKPSKAFSAVIKAIKKTMDEIYNKERDIFSNPSKKPSKNFLYIPDYHAASIVSTMNGMPIHVIQPGPKIVNKERVQLNPIPLRAYRQKLQMIVKRF